IQFQHTSMTSVAAAGARALWHRFPRRLASTSASPPVVSEVRDSVARVTLANPKQRNSLSLETLRLLESTLNKHADDSAVRAVLLRSDGPVFSSGHHLREMDQGEALRRDVMSQCSRLMLRLHSLPLPVIAQVSGLATAAGCQLVVSCDLAVAASSARFATPGVKIGLFCSTPAVALARSVNGKMAMRMLLTGEPITAQEALASGLVSHVAEDADLEATTETLVAMVTRHSRPVVAMGKQTFYQQVKLPRDEAYRLCESTMLANLRLPDAQEGIAAFLEKRQPNWSHSDKEVVEKQK
uniref:Enoyl-CoA hydratase domain-containing protein 3, mitochondrial n=2 Tax=Macrostomum lignano TaxID=282301 RepID=A0A1I8GV99_9PLAT